MNLNGDPNTDDYFVTAVHIFKYCGAESTDTLRVDALMDKFAPFIKTNKAEYSYLKSLLDPEENNPEVSVLTLATVLNKYSENQKIKADLDESFNLKNGQGPHDSDSGISTEGFQLLEELQCELKEKAHLAQQLRSQLDFTDRQHEEQLATVTAERDSLITHLNLLREENIALSHVKRDYEEVCDRLCSSERALDEATRDLDVTRKRARVLVDQLASLESEKVVLQELLQKSKEECHRINEMYASRQSALLEECETLRGQHADLAARLHDHDHYMQQLIKEKVLLEMELKDVFNKSNATQLRMDRSIDVSYTDDQMLTALDSLNLESQFSQENHLLDEESFTNALKEDQGRVTNMSLFDEIRLSFCNMSRRNTINCSGNFDISIKLQNVTTQTEDIEPCVDTNKVQNVIHVETQTDSFTYHYVQFNSENHLLDEESFTNALKEDQGRVTNMSLFDEIRLSFCNMSRRNTINCSGNFDISIKLQNVTTQTEDIEPCVDTNKVQNVIHVETQTDSSSVIENEPYSNNNIVQTCYDCTKCIECEKLRDYATKLESDNKKMNFIISDMQSNLDRYDEYLNNLQKLEEEENKANIISQAYIDGLESNINTIASKCSIELDTSDKLYTHRQTEPAYCSVSTQAEVPCRDCEVRNSDLQHRSLRRYFWEPLKCLLQVFAVVCFVCATCALYNVSRAGTRCREPLPWRWLDAQDLLDLLLRIEYVADVPM
ncbi:hypothetical protein RR46_11414 [Papilio xuthus]|uniref:Uncharacterized protein n=1 Tax=Papilio xuthus TaxID=66420 RepID=A0A194PQH4_PAPXU|nr:hypothetical protein RR46_11414 [Papilio xuthus]